MFQHYYGSFENPLPFARAEIKGDAAHKDLKGTVEFFPFRDGTMVSAELYGLPRGAPPCAPDIFGFHIHEGGDCKNGSDMPFSDAGGHFDRAKCPHPAHTGDLPPIFGSRGYAWMQFYTERFTPGEVAGKTVIIHSQRDDLTTQPAGDSGARIACGVIEEVSQAGPSAQR